MADDEITITAQVVGQRTLKVAGGLRVELDCFEANEAEIAQMAILANRRVVAEITFSGIRNAEKPEKKKRRKAGGEISEAPDKAD